MTTIASGNAALDSILHRLPENLQAHAGRARDQALWMAEAHGIDPDRAGLAALAHDIARAMPEAELLERAAAYGIDVHPVEERMAVLLHGQVGSEILRRECGIDDRRGAGGGMVAHHLQPRPGADCSDRIPGRQAGPREGGQVPLPRPDCAACRGGPECSPRLRSFTRSLWPR